ncbi:MAG: small basic family protein [Clostridia bacterium]|nr:small basic family protein [Clostridia bacterium]MDR3645060.1 small basic family protein [Clostridia bacterium]
MPLLFAALGVLIGVVVALVYPGYIPSAYTAYVAVALLAALDSVVGAINAYARKRFRIGIFVSGFFINTLLAAFLTYVGELLQIDLYIAAIVVFGARIFQNFAELRRILLKYDRVIDKI